MKVPSHLGIQGNEEADSLAESGRLSSPLLRQSVAPQARNICSSLAPRRGVGHTPRQEPVTISDSESVPSQEATSAPPSPGGSQIARPLCDTFAPQHHTISPMTPQRPGITSSPHCTPSPRFISLAESPAARFLAELELQPMMSPDLFVEKADASPSSDQITDFSDGASNQSTISMTSSASTEVSVPRKRPRFRP